jgi:hypothetical protein
MNQSIFAILFLALAIGTAGCGKRDFALPSTGLEVVQTEITNTKVDVIIMVDNSSSMMRHQTKLSNEIPGLISKLNAQGMDWRIGFTTSDLNGSGGVLLGNRGEEFISHTTPDAIAKLQARIVVGENGSDLERGIETVKSSLQAAAGLLRPEAMLSIIFLSDDNDYSATSSAAFVSMVDSLKPPFRSGLRSWVANYIGTVMLTQQCTASLGQWNGVGQKYIDIVKATGGVAESICASDLGQAITNFRVRTSELLTEFPLSRIPKISTIVITVNGHSVPPSTINGWEYIPGKNVIKFHGDQIPNPDDVVTINYDPESAT